MYIRRIRIENIRCFRSGKLAVDLDLRRPDGGLAGWTVLAGRNGAGKTTFLQAVAQALIGSPSLMERVSGWLRDGEERGEVCIHLQNSHDPTQANAGKELRMEWERGRGRSESRAGLAHCDLFVAGYGPFRRLSGHASDAQDLMAESCTASGVVTLFREDASLAEAVQWLREVYLRRLEERPGAADLEQSALHLLQDGLLPGGMQIEKLDSDGLWVRQDQCALPLIRLSEGYRTVTAVVLDIVRHIFRTFGEFHLAQENGRWVVPYEGIVLIDEVDAHLHVSWQQRIGFWFKEHFPNIQFLVTTHSPFICQAANPGGLIRLPAPEEERTAEPVPDELFHTIVNGSPDEAAMTELFGLEHPHSDYSEGLRRRLAELEFKLMRGSLTEEERRERETLSDQLPKTGSTAVERALRKLRGE